MFRYKKMITAAVALSAAALIAVPSAATASGARAAARHPSSARLGMAKAPAGYWGGSSKRCFGVYPASNVSYPVGCYGHDEPQIMPMSTAPGSASNITWTFVLGTDQVGTNGIRFVDLGPTFWVGAALKDAHSLEDAAFEELQFYPDSVLRAGGCGPDGSFNTAEVANSWTVCSPAWAVNPSSGVEYAAFNKMLSPTGHTTPMIMHGGDTVSVSFAGSPYKITVTDATTHQTGTIVMSGGGASDHDGALGPLFPGGENVKTNFFPWGAVQDAPMGLSWEIGHPNFYKYPPIVPECLPGQFDCYSYDVTQGWAPVTPFRITSVVFNSTTKPSSPSSWGVVDTQGGSEEDVTWCGKYDAVATCTFPWYAYNSKLKAITFGANYVGTLHDYGNQLQYATTPKCSNGHGFLIYCNEPLSPAPPSPL